MEVMGRSVKSFNPDPMTGKLIEVTNYPIRVRRAQEVNLANKIKLLRHTQLEVAKVLCFNSCFFDGFGCLTCSLVNTGISSETENLHQGSGSG